MTPHPHFEDERPTGRFHSSARMPAAPPASDPPPDDDATLGLLMAAVVRLEAAHRSLATEVGTLSREVTALGKDMKDEQPALARHTAARTSNRMALLLGTLFTVWEVASPILHEIAKWGAH